MAYNLLLASCLEAEGTEKDMIASAYANAAQAQLADIKQQEDNVFVLQHAVNTREWMRKAIRYSTEYFGATSSVVRKHEENWRKLQLVPQLKLMLHITDLLPLGVVPTRPLSVKDFVLSYWRLTEGIYIDRQQDMLKASQVFALRFILLADGKPAIKCISERECRATLRKQCMSSKTRARARKAVDGIMHEYKPVIDLHESVRELEDCEAALNLLWMEDLPGFYE